MEEDEVQKALWNWVALEEERKQKENEFHGPQIPDENGIINRVAFDEGLPARFAEIESLNEQVQ
ncbi:MAG: hypothetical protein V3S37_01620, partial [Dehalococcoidia bacterium]